MAPAPTSHLKAAAGSAHHAHNGPSRRARRRPLPIVGVMILIASAVALVAYLLWPRWPAEAALDAPALPITVGDVIFNVPPAAIRRSVQRRPGAQDRIDLVFLWPNLTPPDPKMQREPVATSEEIDRIFLTIAVSDATLPPIERVKTIYPRYLENHAAEAAAGWTVRPFRDGTPYQGEELFYRASDPERFVVRCTRNGARNMVGICLYDHRIGSADITARFPRDWLKDGESVPNGLQRLLASLSLRAR